MGRWLGPKHKLCRKFGAKLCDSPKCPVARRSYPPGMHGPRQKNVKLSSFAKQLREKQKAKRLFGIMERQFANYVASAGRKKGDTSKFFLAALAARLDNVVYSAGLSASRAAARQAVSHGHLTVNGKRVSIPSYRVREGEVVAVRDTSRSRPLFANLAERINKRELPAWLAVNANEWSAKIVGAPTLDPAPFDSQLIIGFYSR
ncbi:MAG: 30S ribosomal protein S4 [Candidatus Magasanikbacteria bacterium]|nr:30S ribosomal protein S4 [Candidatus Magasanikbacteria bacterium]